MTRITFVNHTSHALLPVEYSGCIRSISKMSAGDNSFLIADRKKIADNYYYKGAINS